MKNKIELEIGSKNSTQININYFSDILCIWAFAAEVRLVEIIKNYGSKVAIYEHFSPIFSDTHEKIELGWADRGGFEGFATHNQKIAQDLGFISVHEKVWREVRPQGSTPAHLVLKALQNMGEYASARSFAKRLRSAFFEEAMDIGQLKIVLELAEQEGFKPASIEQQINSGQAMTALMADHKMHYEQHIKGSPTYIMNEGRQILFGNVGYRIIEANITELIDTPHKNIASWC